MPAKGSIIRYHGRHNFLCPKLWKKYKTVTGVDISYAEFKSIVLNSMLEIQKWVLRDPIGFQLSRRIGVIAVNRFKPRGEFKAYYYHNKQKIRNHNLHTGGDVYKIQWFRGVSNVRTRLPYWFFTAERKFNRALKTTLHSTTCPHFNAYMQNHYVNNTWNK